MLLHSMMIIDLLKDAERTWREITKLAEPLDADKPVVIGSNPNSQAPFEAYTDNKKIYININDEQKFRDNFEKIVVPTYKIAAEKLYDVANKISEPELLKNLVLDNFLFMHFHEQMHPLLCPNSEFDEKKITRTLYEGIKEAEPNLSKAEVMYKVNNCKNLIWDIVLNVSIISKTSGCNNENLEQKISYVFQKDGRQIEYQPVMHYPSGILPIVYMTSAKNRTTDIPISLVGAMYATMSYNASSVRQKAMGVFFDDLRSKKMRKHKSEKLLQEMYNSFVSGIDDKLLQKRGVDKNEYLRRISTVVNYTSPGYEGNQQYFVSALTKIFDSPGMRYESLKGLIKVLAPYISLQEKQGSPDPNTKGHGGGDDSDGELGGGGGQGEEEQDNDDQGDGSGDNQDDTDGKDDQSGGSDDSDGSDDQGDQSGSGGGGSQDEDDYGSSSQDDKEAESIIKTMDDLLDELDGKEADDLLGQVANGGGYGPAGRQKGIDVKISIIAADEYYKKNADLIEVQNPTEGNESMDIGSRKRWRLVRSSNLTAIEASKLNHKQITAFQRATGLPILMEASGGYYKLNEYREEETPLKSFTRQKTGIDIPDNWVIFQDSSGSMAGPAYVGTGCRFDLLNRVKYGIMKGLYDVCKKMQKDLQFGVVDFSYYTKYSGMDSLVKIYKAKQHPIKTVSLTPQCGGTTLNNRIFNQVAKDLKPGKSIYTFITDGEISTDHNTLLSKIDKFAAQPENAFVFVEIDSASQIGREVEHLSKRNPSVLYYGVSDVSSIKDRLSSVLIRYD